MAYKIVIIRHGESIWNAENKFTGWTDVDLSEKGVLEAQKAGKILKKNNFEFDLAYTSYLKRAIKTLNIVLEEMDQLWLPIMKDWRWNERHYGALQGFNKAEMSEKVGKDQVHLWRRSFSTQPPALEKKDPRYPGHDRRYQDLNEKDIPLTECLKDTIDRFMPLWKNDIIPLIKEGKRLIISAHGNTIRALVKHLDNISDTDIPNLNIPTGVPLVYELDKNIKPIQKYYLEQ